MFYPCEICGDAVSGRTHFTCGDACRQAKSRGKAIRYPREECLVQGVAEDDFELVKPILNLYGKAVVTLSQCKEEVDNALGVSVLQEHLKGILERLGWKSSYAQPIVEQVMNGGGQSHSFKIVEGGEGKVFYHGKHVEELMFQMKGVRAIRNTEVAGSLECDHKGSVMFGGLCRCAYENQGAGLMSPGSSQSLYEQRLAAGLVDMVEPHGFNGTEDDLARIAKDSEIEMKLARQKEYEDTKAVQENYDLAAKQQIESHHETAKRIRAQLLIEREDQIEGSAIEVVTEDAPLRKRVKK